MGIKSSRGKSSVSVPHAISKNPNTGIKVVSGKGIVGKKVNAHRANPGYKSKGM